MMQKPVRLRPKKMDSLVLQGNKQQSFGFVEFYKCFQKNENAAFLSSGFVLFLLSSYFVRNMECDLCEEYFTMLYKLCGMIVTR